ncbi:hypothetical protein EQZ23_05185 [Sphingomonas sp. UV9]|uniref:hypothetical protein n=1 Tax=Sphingomonas sp. UV9 TaxID=1851410 RepID=UPI000FFB6A91|nr:hypothetical protein [Sphingomonas sp. UV9]RXD07430.1 hypothetical protein EQZ23_05185 [Sphingomonas sp. UV9]
MKAQTMRRIRQYHFYLGMFFAPAILLFALSGALQTFRLQEAKGYGGTPPGWIVWMANVHKDQSLPRENRGGPLSLTPSAPRAGAASGPSTEMSSGSLSGPARRGADRPFARISPLPLKIFVVLMSIGLLASAILGIVIALTNRTMRRTSVIVLVAGAVLPLLLLLA